MLARRKGSPVSKIFRSVAILLIAAGAAGCSRDAVPIGPRLIERTYASMGSELRLTAWTNDEQRAVIAFDAVSSEFERLEGLLSNWREHSEVLELNTAAGKEPVRVSTELRDV